MTEIEDQLRALGERWSHTCQWTLQQLQRLQDMRARWTQLEQRHAELLALTDSHETAPKQVTVIRQRILKQLKRLMD